jgi:hypothetical protein
MNNGFGTSRHRGRALLALCLLPVLAGCTTWVKPGADEAAADAAQTHCKAVSYGTLPAQIQNSTTRGASYSDRKKCEKNSANGCVKSGDRYYAIIKTSSDANSEGRDAIFRDCMYQSGWRAE